MKAYEYRTNWFLTDEWDTDKRIYGIIDRFYSNPPKRLRNVELWGQYVSFVYISLARRTEPFRMNPTISRLEHAKHIFYRITRVNEKSFEGTKLPAERRRRNADGKFNRAVTNRFYKPKRSIISQIFMPMNEFERALFEMLLKGKQQATLDFTPLLFPYRYNMKLKASLQSETFVSDPMTREKERRVLANFSKRFAMRFPEVITDGRRTEEAGMVPHMIRHIRTYNLTAVKGFPKDKVQKLGGWKTDMVGYYADVRRSIEEADMFRFYDSLPSK